MSLQNEFQWYLDHQSELVGQYSGKYLVILNNAVVGAYDKKDDALFDAQKKYEAGSYIIQLCTPGTEAYTMTYHTHRVSFTHPAHA